MMTDGFVSVSRRVGAPAEQLFALLADSANHPLIDGSGMVLEPAPAITVSKTGDAFVMNMHHGELGYYQMSNEVVEYEPGRRGNRARWPPRESMAATIARPTVVAMRWPGGQAQYAHLVDRGPVSRQADRLRGTCF